MDLSIDASPEQLEAMNGAVVNYVRNRPQSWRSGVIEFHIYSLNPDRNSMSVAFWLRHRHPFQNGTAVFGDTSLFLLFVSRTLKKMGIRYHLPRQPIEIMGQRGVDVMGDDDLTPEQRKVAERARADHHHQALHAEEHMPHPPCKTSGGGISSRRSKRYGWSDSESEDEDATDHANSNAVRRLAAAESTSHCYQDIKMGSIAQIWRDEQRVHVPVAPALDEDAAWEAAQLASEAPLVDVARADPTIEEGGASPDLHPDVSASRSDLAGRGVNLTHESVDLFTEGRRVSHGQGGKRSASPMSDAGDMPPGLEMRTRPLTAEHRNSSWDSLQAAPVFGPATRPKGLDVRHNVGSFAGISLGETTPKPAPKHHPKPHLGGSRAGAHGPQDRSRMHSTAGDAAGAAGASPAAGHPRASGISRSSSFGQSEATHKSGIKRTSSDRATKE